jgi:hypothetical protein
LPRAIDCFACAGTDFRMMLELRTRLGVSTLNFPPPDVCQAVVGGAVSDGAAVAGDAPNVTTAMLALVVTATTAAMTDRLSRLITFDTSCRNEPIAAPVCAGDHRMVNKSSEDWKNILRETIVKCEDFEHD